MSGERTLVTGAAGRLGSAVVGALVSSGREVVATDRVPMPEGLPGSVIWRQSELSDPAVVTALIEGGRVGRVVHLAALPGPQWHPPEIVFTANTSATFAVLAAAARCEVARVVLASSCSAYGIFWSPNEVSPRYAPIDEEHPLLPEDPYALSKQADEATAAMFHRANGLSVALLRFPAITTTEYQLQRAAQIAADPADGRRGLWSYVHIDDAASAVLAALHAADLGCEAINVAAADSLSDVPTEELLRRHHPMTSLRGPIPGTGTVWDISKADRRLGWRPRRSWRDSH